MYREVKAKESNKGELLDLAGQAKGVLDGHAADVEALTAELAKADEIAAEREREFITAKDAAAALATRLAAAKWVTLAPALPCAALCDLACAVT